MPRAEKFGKGRWGVRVLSAAGRLAKESHLLALNRPVGSPPPGIEPAPWGARSPPSVHCAGAGAAAHPLRAPGGGRGCEWRGPAGHKLPRSRPSASRGTERCPWGGALGTLVEKGPPRPFLRAGGGAPSQGARDGKSPARAPRAPPRRSRAERGALATTPRISPTGRSPSMEKLAAAGGGQILTFSARRPDGERGGEEQERPQRGRLHPCGFRTKLSSLRNKNFKKRGGEGEGRSPAQSSPRFP